MRGMIERGELQPLTMRFRDTSSRPIFRTRRSSRDCRLSDNHRCHDDPLGHHAVRIVDLGKTMLDSISESFEFRRLALRIGVHSGPVAGA